MDGVAIVNQFRNIPPFWQFLIFAVILVMLASWTPTRKFAYAIAAIVLLGQLLAMSKKGFSL